MKQEFHLVYSSGVAATVSLQGTLHSVKCKDLILGQELDNLVKLVLKSATADQDSALFKSFRENAWAMERMEHLLAMSGEFFTDAKITLSSAKRLDVEYRKQTELLTKFSLGRQLAQTNRHCVVMLAMSLEAYINEYGTDRLGEAEFERFERLSPRDKWIVVPKVDSLVRTPLCGGCLIASANAA